MNRIILQGRLTDAPELRYTPSGVAVASFTLAVQRSYKDKNGNYLTDFIPCVAWRGTAELMANNLAKGNRVIVEGRLETRTYEDQSGNRRKVYEVVTEKAHLIDWGDAKKRLKDDIENDNVDPWDSGEFSEPIDLTDDDLPF